MLGIYKDKYFVTYVCVGHDLEGQHNQGCPVEWRGIMEKTYDFNLVERIFPDEVKRLKGLREKLDFTHEMKKLYENIFPNDSRPDSIRYTKSKHCG